MCLPNNMQCSNEPFEEKFLNTAFLNYNKTDFYTLRMLIFSEPEWWMVCDDDESTPKKGPGFLHSSDVLYEKYGQLTRKCQ